jgi:hypothetical protein
MPGLHNIVVQWSVEVHRLAGRVVNRTRRKMVAGRYSPPFPLDRDASPAPLSSRLAPRRVAWMAWRCLAIVAGILGVWGGVGWYPEPLSGDEPNASRVLAKQDILANPVPFPVTRVTLKGNGKAGVSCEGQVLAVGEDGGCLLLEKTGRLRVLVAKEILEQQLLATQSFAPMDHEQLSQTLLQELPSGFKTTSTKHYLIAYDTTEAYAKWNAALYERLLRGFYTFWKRLGIELQEPEFPLVTIVFSSRQGYLKYAEKDQVKNAASMIGYYNMLTNRVATYDLTGIEEIIPDGKRVETSDLVNAILSRPAAERAVATIVHEAVHQLAYNCGLQRRLADNPIAISEGLAMFFEAPDLKNPSGWGGIGKVSGHNLAIFRQAMAARAAKPISELIQDDSLFHDPATVSIAYGESWALTYYLIKTKSKQFTAYLKELAQRPPLEATDPKRRLEDFQRFFGDDFEKLERDFIKYLSRVQM